MDRKVEAGKILNRRIFRISGDLLQDGQSTSIQRWGPALGVNQEPDLKYPKMIKENFLGQRTMGKKENNFKVQLRFFPDAN